MKSSLLLHFFLGWFGALLPILIQLRDKIGLAGASAQPDGSSSLIRGLGNISPIYILLSLIISMAGGILALDSFATSPTLKIWGAFAVGLGAEKAISASIAYSTRRKAKGN